MTITKRKRKYEEIQNIPHSIPEIQFKFSIPKIVTKDRFKTDDFYYYVFCGPQTENNIIKTPEKNIDTQDSTGSKVFDKMPTGNEIIPVIRNTTGYKIPGDVKEPINVAGNYNPVSVLVVEKTELLDSLKNVNNDKIQKEFLENAYLGNKNETSHIELVDLFISGKTNVEDNITHVKDSMDVGLCDPEKDFMEVKIVPITVIKTDDLTSINEKNPLILSAQNNLFNQYKFDMNSKFIFSNPIPLESNQNTKDNMIFTLNFPTPENGGTSSNHEAKNSKEFKEVYNPKHDIRPKKVKTNLTWIFTKSCDNNELFEKSQVPENFTNDIANPETKGDECTSCWLFKHLNKCEYCKKLNVKMTDEDKQYAVKNTELDSKSNDDTIKPVDIATVFDENVEVQPIQLKIGEYAKERKIEKKWQCNFCLTNNNKDRFTCYCCESKKYIENGNCKVTFGNNKTFSYEKQERGSQMANEIDISMQETKPFIVIDEAMMDTKIGTSQDNFEIQMDNNKDTNSVYNMDTETDTFNYTLEKMNEEMDVEEESFIPNTVQKFEPVPILAANIVPYVGANIQFNVGSNPIQNVKGARKFKRAVRNIPKAFHK